MTEQDELRAKLLATIEKWVEVNRYREIGLPTYAETGGALADAILHILQGRLAALREPSPCGVQGHRRCDWMDKNLDAPQEAFCIRCQELSVCEETERNLRELLRMYLDLLYSMRRP